MTATPWPMRIGSLVLREASAPDIERLLSFRNDAEVNRFMIRTQVEPSEFRRVACGTTSGTDYSCVAELDRTVVAMGFLEKAGMRREQHGVEDSWHADLGWVDGYRYAMLARVEGLAALPLGPVPVPRPTAAPAGGLGMLCPWSRWSSCPRASPARAPRVDARRRALHPGIARAVIEEFSTAGDVVLDPFAGYGTTLVVSAEPTGRRSGSSCCPREQR
ncbi:MAG: DNA methyltransferase [Nocardioides sp.]